MRGKRVLTLFLFGLWGTSPATVAATARHFTLLASRSNTQTLLASRSNTITLLASE